MCPKGKTEKQLQEIKTNRILSYLEARSLIAPQLSPSYAQAAKSSTINNSVKTDENITKIKCPPLNMLQPLSSLPKTNTSISTPAVSTSSSTQVHVLPSTSSIAAIVFEPQPPIPVSDSVLSTTSNMFTPIKLSSSIIFASSSITSIQPPSASTTRDLKQNSKLRARQRKKELLKNERNCNRHKNGSA
ncbi:uncharacterized protein TNCV_3399711 [Trichonephila clavipes]|nr:uncharacterized protein TNCV_3399711 [Trichonephila clavipes]